MAARDGHVVEEDLALGRPAERGAVVLEGERLSRAAAAGAHDERWTFDAEVGERDGVVLRGLLGRERHGRVRPRLVMDEERSALGTVVGRLLILEAAFGTVDCHGALP